MRASECWFGLRPAMGEARKVLGTTGPIGDKVVGAKVDVDLVVTVRGLVKRYGRREAVRGVDLDVRRGEIFAFLGPNGAGKTTTVEILEGFRERTDGEVRVLGVDPAEGDAAWRDRVGIVLQESEPEPGLSVRECSSCTRAITVRRAMLTTRSRSSGSTRRPMIARMIFRAGNGAAWTSHWR